jgi:hypothetical protein
LAGDALVVYPHNIPHAITVDAGVHRRVWNTIRRREHFTAGSWWQTQQSVTPFNTCMVTLVTGLSFFYCSMANQILGVFYCLRLDTTAGSPVRLGRSCCLGIAASSGQSSEYICVAVGDTYYGIAVLLFQREVCPRCSGCGAHVSRTLIMLEVMGACRFINQLPMAKLNNPTTAFCGSDWAARQ